MHSRVTIVICSIAVLLLVVSSNVINADDQYYAHPRKIFSGNWHSVHRINPLEKRGRFVFREAPNAHHYDSVNDDVFINDDVNDADSNVDKRNWRL